MTSPAELIDLRWPLLVSESVPREVWSLLAWLSTRRQKSLTFAATRLNSLSECCIIFRFTIEELEYRLDLMFGNLPSPAIRASLRCWVRTLVSVSPVGTESDRVREGRWPPNRFIGMPGLSTGGEGVGRNGADNTRILPRDWDDEVDDDDRRLTCCWRRRRSGIFFSSSSCFPRSSSFGRQNDTDLRNVLCAGGALSSFILKGFTNSNEDTSVSSHHVYARTGISSTKIFLFCFRLFKAEEELMIQLMGYNLDPRWILYSNDHWHAHGYLSLVPVRK